jgi:hypothetical protein
VRRAALLAAVVSLAATRVPAEEPGAGRADADLLVRNGLHFAERALKDAGGVAPFALVMVSDGRISRLQPALRKQMPSARELLDELEEVLRERARTEDLRAVAVFSDVVIALPEGGESNAIHASWEHRSGVCADLYLPYMLENKLQGTKKDPGKSTLRLGERIETPRRASMFERCEADLSGGAPSAAPAGR